MTSSMTDAQKVKIADLHDAVLTALTQTFGDREANFAAVFAEQNFAPLLGPLTAVAVVHTHTNMRMFGKFDKTDFMQLALAAYEFAERETNRIISENNLSTGDLNPHVEH